MDEPLIWYEGPNIFSTARRYFSRDERGSIIAVTDSTGAPIDINAYDEYGIPNGALTGANTNTGRFQYTGQIWLPEVGLYHYKARAYSPTLGRFMQPDPIGVAGGINLYAYVHNDPVNYVDPSGLVPCVARGSYGCPVLWPDGVIVVGHSDWLAGMMNAWLLLDDVFGRREFRDPTLRTGVGMREAQSDECSVRHPDGSTATSNAQLVGRGANAARTLSQLTPVAGALAYGAVAGAWLGSVLPGSIWDYKRHGGTDSMGNVNYGATGTALGIPLTVLQRAAGAVQGLNPENQGRWYDTSADSSYGDQPRDQLDIKKGATCAG